MRKRLFSERVKWRLLRTLGISPNYMSYSQAGEDRILNHLVNVLGIHPVLYVDIGCNDPVFANNTYLAYCQGSAGIVVDPAIEFESQYRRLRPRDKFIRAAVSDNPNGTARLSIFENGALSTLCEETAANYIRLGQKCLRVEEVQTVTLSQLLAQAERNVDLLSIDVEGKDLAILKSHDFTAHAPTMICVETVGYASNTIETFDESIQNFLVSRGYRIYANSHINTIFVRSELYDVVPKI